MLLTSVCSVQFPNVVLTSNQVDTLSELFVSWDETIRDAEEEVQRMEKEVDQKSKSSYMDWMTSKMKIGKNRSSKSEQPQQ